MNIFIGTAGWSIPRESAAHFPGEGSHLERYARQLKAVEIDTSFYRPHLPATYARWAAAAPPGFRFTVKTPMEVTHMARLTDAARLDRFADESGALGERLGAWLLQLPPGLAFNPVTVERFLDRMRSRFTGDVVCEPRHPSWFTPASDRLLADFRVARAAADPAISPEGTRPGGWDGLVYYRLHGSPEMYRSSYAAEFLKGLAGQLKATSGAASVWCIFNNTAAGAAVKNALDLQDQIRPLSGV